LRLQTSQRACSSHERWALPTLRLHALREVRGRSCELDRAGISVSISHAPPSSGLDYFRARFSEQLLEQCTMTAIRIFAVASNREIRVVRHGCEKGDQS